jgi:hypothetical protein
VRVRGHFHPQGAQRSLLKLTSIPGVARSENKGLTALIFLCLSAAKRAALLIFRRQRWKPTNLLRFHRHVKAFSAGFCPVRLATLGGGATAAFPGPLLLAEQAQLKWTFDRLWSSLSLGLQW